MSNEYADLHARPVGFQAFRPQRQLARSFLHNFPATVELGGETYPVHDLAMNGISILAPSGVFPVEKGEDAQIRLRVAGDLLHQGFARVVRIVPSGTRNRVALQLVTGFLDLPRLAAVALDKELERDLTTGPEAVRSLVPGEFRQVVEEIVHLLSYYRRLLDAHEASQVADGGSPIVVRDALARRAADSMRPRWEALRIRASAVAASQVRDTRTLRACKKYVEALIAPLARPSPLYHRSYAKPLGYPGDHRAMLHIYADAFEGESAFGAALNKLACEEPLAAGVRHRRDLLVTILGEELDRLGTSDDPMRVTSLACGPAREVSAFLRRPTWPRPIEFMLVDQQEEALSLAYEEFHRAMASGNARARARCVYLSFGQMLQRPDQLASEEPQDLVYSAGLMDYLPMAVAAGLIRGFYERLRPGGLLAMGNATKDNQTFFLEYACDWTLLYRNPEEMRALAADLPGARVSVRAEPTGVYQFLLVRRP